MSEIHSRRHAIQLEKNRSALANITVLGVVIVTTLKTACNYTLASTDPPETLDLNHFYQDLLVAATDLQRSTRPQLFLS